LDNKIFIPRRVPTKKDAIVLVYLPFKKLLPKQKKRKQEETLLF